MLRLPVRNSCCQAHTMLDAQLAPASLVDSIAPAWLHDNQQLVCLSACDMKLLQSTAVPTAAS